MIDFLGMHEAAKKCISQAKFCLPEAYTAMTEYIFMSSIAVAMN
jgi:hypothetical protein